MLGRTVLKIHSCGPAEAARKIQHRRNDWTREWGASVGVVVGDHVAPGAVGTRVGGVVGGLLCTQQDGPAY